MPSLNVSTCLLAITSVLIGFLGSHWLGAWVQERRDAEFRGLLQAVAVLVSAADWQEPWDSDPAWSQLEQQLDLDLVPVSFADKQASAPPAVAPIASTRSSSGSVRMTAVLELPGAPADAAGDAQPALRVTREVAPQRIEQLWWMSWGLLCLAAAGVVGSALADQRRHRQQWQGLLDPWLAALQGPPRPSQLLPKIERQSPLASDLKMVSQALNRLFGELHDQNERSELVLGNLQEGVLAIDDRSHVLLANQALHQLLDLPREPYLDRLLLELVRIPQVSDLAERVVGERRCCEAMVELPRPSRVLRIIGRPLPLNASLQEVGGDVTPSDLPESVAPAYEPPASEPPASGPQPTGAQSLPRLSLDSAPQVHDRFGALLTVRDETALRRLETIRRDFVANASHELKTPLAAIRAYAETLQLGALDDRPIAEKFVINIMEQADRIHGLVQGMLQLSRVEAGTALKFEWFDLLQAAEPCLAATRAVARAKDIAIATEFPAEPLQIRCDRDSFQTILSNLLSNAVRYTHRGGRVLVTVSQSGATCVLRVKDTGIGISQEDLERIFERFYRAEKGRSTETGGTGLGLSIVKHLVHALGGSVHASSQPGDGSCFEVRLPVRGPA